MWGAAKVRNGQIVGLAWIVLLIVSSILWILCFRGLYADGSFHLAKILAKKGFYAAQPSRIFAYGLVEAPLLIALKLGAHNIRTLAGMQSLGFTLVPLAAYALSLWLARNSLVLFSATGCVIAAVYYLTALFHVGEFHVGFALYWLATVALLTKTPLGDRIACAVGVLCLFAYDAGAIVGLAVGGIALWRARSQPGDERRILVASAVLFFLSAVVGIVSSLFVPQLTGGGQFRNSLIHVSASLRAWLVVGLCLLTFFAAVLARGRARLPAIVMVAVATVAAGSILLSPSPFPTFGVPYDMRAVAFVALLFFVSASFLAVEFRQDRKVDLAAALIVSMPIVLCFGIDTRATAGWIRYFDSFCAELAHMSGESSAPDFHAAIDTVKYGWNWTDPYMSILLRPVGSDAIILNRPDWPAFRPHLDKYKANGASLCRD